MTFLRSSNQHDVAKRVGCSQSFISRLLSGEKNVERLRHAVRFERLGIAYTAWLTDEKSGESIMPTGIEMSGTTELTDAADDNSPA